MKSEKRNGFWLMTGGLLLMAAALLLACWNIWADHRAASSAAAILLDLPSELFVVEDRADAPAAVEPTQEFEIPDYLLDPTMEMPVTVIDGREFVGVIQIPFLKLELPVLSQWSDADSKIAPCRYRGTAYQNDLIIAGHNYKSCFKNLKNVPVGEQVLLTDMDGNVFAYTVSALEVIGGSDVEGMESGEWDLTLFTCTYGGQSRVALRCEKV